MNVSVHKPSGEFVARMEIVRMEDIPERLQELLSAGTRIPLRSRVQTVGQSWVIVGFNPIQLREEEQRQAVSAATPVIETEWRRRGSGSAARRQMMIGPLLVHRRIGGDDRLLHGGGQRSGRGHD